MSDRREIDLALGILDHQLIDADDRRCGKVDDLELEGIGEGRPVVAAIVSGPSGWRGRGLMGRLAARLSRGRAVHIRWEQVADVDSAVRLGAAASELRLGRGDDRARRIVEKVPGASL